MRQNAKSTVISQGDAKIISSADVVEIQRRQAAKADARKAKADAKRAKADAKKAKAPSKRKWEVESMAPTHEPGVQACQMVVDVSAPCPGKALVAQIW